MSTDTPSPASSYDTIPYPTRAQPLVHPERLAAMGTLYGIEAAPVASASVLELGCGDGKNLAAVAAAFPGSRCVGCDLSGAAIARGRDFAERCGLRNLELRQADVAGDPLPDGPFDYVLCHGLYAWVPEATRAGILRQCRHQLAPAGIALVSYDALPGGCVRQAVHRMLRWHVRELPDAVEQVTEARALARFLTEATPETDELGRALRAELRAALAKESGFFYHDELAGHYAPVAFHDFVHAAERQKLRFLADGDPAELTGLNVSPEALQLLRAFTDDRVERQQYFDFLLGRRFHHTLLCRQECTVAEAPRLDRLDRCWFSAQGRTATPEKLPVRGAVAVFERPDGARLETDFLPGKLAMAHLQAANPRRCALGDLRRIVREELARHDALDLWTAETRSELSRFLLEACAPKIATLHGASPEVQPTAGEWPVAFPVARVQAADGAEVTSAFHQMFILEDRWSRELLARADGTRTRARLREDLASLARATTTAADLCTWQRIEGDFDAALNALARQGLLIA